MRQHANRLTVLALAAVSVVFVGCDGPQTQRDKEIRQKLNEAREDSPKKAPTAAGATGALALHEAAAKIQGASLPSSIEAWTFVGQDYYSQAISTLGTLDEFESAATLALQRIQTGIMAIERNNVQLKILAASDPAEVVKALSAAKADQIAQSGASGELVKKTQVLATAQEGKIKETQSKLAAATDEMNQLFQKSELAKGQEAVELYTKAVAVRQTVQNTSHELAEQQLDLSRLQRTVAEATAAQQTTAASAIATQKSIEQITATWAETQKAIAARKDENKSIMESQIVPQAKSYVAAMAGAAKVRKEIETRFDKAIAAYQAAGKDAGALLRDFMTWKQQDSNNALNPSFPARKSLADSHEPLWYSMLAAKAMLARGTLGVNLVQILDRQNQLVESELKAALLEAKLMMPAELVPSNLTSQLADARKQTDTLLKDADDVFAQAGESSVAALSKEAGMLRVASQYAIYVHSGFKSAVNFQTAQAALREFAKTGAPVPRLPAQLEARTVTRTGPTPQLTPTPTVPRNPDKTPVTPDSTGPTTAPVVPSGTAPTALPGPAVPPGPGIGFPNLSGFTNIIPGMKKKAPNTPTPNDNK